MSEQEEQVATQPDGEISSQAQERTSVPAPRREPSMRQVAKRIAARLGVSEDEALMTRIRQIVWDLGRTQVQSLCAEALEGDDAGPQGYQTLLERFLGLVETKGVKKERPWLQDQRERPDEESMNRKSTQLSGGPSRSREVASMIAAQLGERQQSSAWQTIQRSVKALGVEAALALLQRTHEVEASGGMQVPDGSRRRTPGGVYFWLVRQEATEEQHRVIFQYAGPKSANSGHVQSMPKKERVKPATQPPTQPGVSFSWKDRGQILAEAEQKKGNAKTVKITLVGRPGQIVEQGRCFIVSMQQAAKIPPLPSGLPLPPVEQVGATNYSVYIASKQWKKVAEAIKDEEDALIVEGLPFLDAEHSSIAVLASNITTRNLQRAAKAPKPPASGSEATSTEG